MGKDVFGKYYFYNTPLLCNESCLFCLSHTKKVDKMYPISISKILRDFYKIKKLGFDSIIIGGGEPTIIENFIDILNICKKIGIRFYTITNGQRFADKEFLNSCVTTGGLSGIIFSIHHFDEKSFDFLVQKQGAFQNILQALKNAQSFKILYIASNTALVGLNQSKLFEIILFLRSKKVKYSNFCNFEINRTEFSLGNKKEMYTDLNTIREQVSQLIKSGIDLDGITFQNLPLCVFPKEYIFLSRESSGTINYLEENHLEYIDGKIGAFDFRTKHNICTDCMLNSRCRGVFEYIDSTQLTPF